MQRNVKAATMAIAVLISWFAVGSLFASDGLQSAALRDVQSASFGVEGEVFADDELSVGQIEQEASCLEQVCTCSSECGHWLFNAEATWLEFRTQNITSELYNTEFKLAPRIELGYSTCDGLGIRTRFWDFDQKFVLQEELHVQTYNIDLEVFDKLCADNWWFDVAFGLRYNEFDQNVSFNGDRNPFAEVSFKGWGGTLGLQGNRCVTSSGSIYCRARISLLEGNREPWFDFGGEGESTSNMVELGMGYEWCKATCLGTLLARGGLEWQSWSNYEPAFNNPFVEGRDIMFFGGVFGVGLSR